MLDLKMIKLKIFQIFLTAITISVLLFFIPFESHSDKINDWWGVPEYQRGIPSDDSFISKFNFISVTTHYQIRDNSGGLICIVQSDNVQIYDSKVTFDYLSSHPLRTTFENNGEIINYVPIKESWNVGEGDTFLSALKTTMFDPVEELELYSFFATTNGCAVQPGDKVTVIWEIIYN